jgi:thioredoxin reductase (NADPH)
MPIKTDAVIIGAGPVGLFQAFQLGLQDIRCHIIDALPHVGGQCVELYGDKPIYDIPGIPLCTGRELIEQLQQQVKPFAPTLHLNQEVVSVEVLPNGELEIHTSTQQHFVCKTLFIAAGVGAFQARKLTVDGAQAFEGTHIHYRLGELSTYANQDVWVLGGEETAIATALQLIESSEHKPRSVTLMHRRDVFQAEPALEQAMRQAVAQGRLQLQIGQLATLHTGATSGAAASQAANLSTSPQEPLHAIGIATATGEIIERPAQQLIACLGLSPKLGPITQWGLAMARKQLVVNTETYATDVPGIFAVGDINTYPGKKKLILCGFHEATLAAFGAAAIVHPTRKTLLQYTTTSSEIHRLLGIA